MDTFVDTAGTAFICPECTFSGSSLPELISHMNDAHAEETASKSEAPAHHLSANPSEKRSRRKPAFSHQIVSQAARKSLPQPTVDPDSLQFWNRIVAADKNDQHVSQYNGNFHINRDENVKHANVTPPRPIAPKLPMNTTQIMNSTPIVSPSPPPPSFYSSTSMQPIQKNFQCRICQLTYKNFHDCTAHIRRKHEITHVQAGRYVEKLDTDVPLPPSATGHYKIRVKVKSLPPPATTAASDDPSQIFQCKYCSYTSHRSADIIWHEEQKHRVYSQDEHDEGIEPSPGLLIDEIQSFGEEVPSQNEEMMMIEEDIDEDEDEALWNYQRQINNLPESTHNSGNGNGNGHYHHQHDSFSKHLKKFQCPHCEHSAPTLTKLKLHIATHINIKPFMCSICGWRGNLRWYIQCHAKKRHPNQPFEVLQLSHEEAEQTINAYMKEHGCDSKLTNRHDSKHQYQCSLCQFRSKHPRYIQQHIESTHRKALKSNNNSNNHSNATAVEVNSIHSSAPSNIMYANFSTHPNFNPNRLYYCALCYRGYRWRYDVKRHHKTMHETLDDEASKSRTFHYLEYVPHLDGLIAASMSSLNNPAKHEHEMDDEDDLRLSIADARTVDVTDDEAAALLMIEPDKADGDHILIEDHPEDSVIVFEDDRMEKSSSSEVAKASARPSFKPYRCPHCFYRTNWRTDCLRHIRARHKIEPYQNGYFEMPAEDAANTYDEYERTYGFVVAKKVLARFTDFRQITWEDLRQSIWEKIKDKTDFEQSIMDRLRPDNYRMLPAPAPIIVTIPNKLPIVKPKRMFVCTECAFRTQKIHELDRHVCSITRKSEREKSHGKCIVSLYECSKCLYRTRNQLYARQHISLHRLKQTRKKRFYYCSFCGYNHRSRLRMIVHTANHHPTRTPFNTIVTCRFAIDADFSIRQAILRRSFIERHLNNRRMFHCTECPHVSISILEHDHHRSCHQRNAWNAYRCQHCSFASISSLYTNQHALLHLKQVQLLSSTMDMRNLNDIPVSMIHKEILGKSNRYRCPFCKRCVSSHSSVVLKHIKTTHAGNSNLFHDSLIIGAEAAKELLFSEGNMHHIQRMDIG